MNYNELLKETKTNTVVIMDGSDKRVVEYIKQMLNEWSPITEGRPMVYSLDKDHPSMVVVKARLFENELNHVNDLIERRFPGLCMFNPPMAV